MVYKTVLTSRAELEIEDAVDWYESRQVNLGFRFLEELKSHILQIAKSPLRYPKKYNAFRELQMRKFPFVVIFQLMDTQIVIYSVFNTYRNPANKPS